MLSSILDIIELQAKLFPENYPYKSMKFECPFGFPLEANVSIFHF